jgi:predicted transcriptional regulator
MSKIDDKLNEFLGIGNAEDATYENEVKPEPKKDLIVPEEKDPDIDFETGRKNLYNLIDKGNEAIDGILNLAKEGEHPRAYEVAGQLIKTVSEVSQNLLDLQDKLKKIKDVPDKGPKNVTNALFVGSTTELQKMLKGKKE